jgi:hypothetical protein
MTHGFSLQLSFYRFCRARTGASPCHGIAAGDHERYSRSRLTGDPLAQERAMTSPYILEMPAGSEPRALLFLSKIAPDPVSFGASAPALEPHRAAFWRAFAQLPSRAQALEALAAWAKKEPRAAERAQAAMNKSADSEALRADRFAAEFLAAIECERRMGQRAKLLGLRPGRAPKPLFPTPAVEGEKKAQPIEALPFEPPPTPGAESMAELTKYQMARAIYQGDYDGVRHLIAVGHNPNELASLCPHYAPLFCALGQGSPGMVTHLCDLGADPNLELELIPMLTPPVSFFDLSCRVINEGGAVTPEHLYALVRAGARVDSGARSFRQLSKDIQDRVWQAQCGGELMPTHLPLRRI